jgi:hypothetical protein
MRHCHHGYGPNEGILKVGQIAYTANLAVHPQESIGTKLRSRSGPCLFLSITQQSGETICRTLGSMFRQPSDACLIFLRLINQPLPQETKQAAGDTEQ